MLVKFHVQPSATRAACKVDHASAHVENFLEIRRAAANHRHFIGARDVLELELRTHVGLCQILVALC